MRKYRFPKAAYVRQLERLYDDLSGWREVYGREGTPGQWKRPRWQFVQRAQDLEQVQHDLMVAINHLYGLQELS